MSETLKVETADGIRVLTVHRPEKLNALNDEVMAALDAAIDQARSDEAVGVVVVTGSGEKSFIAGADILELSKLSPLGGRDHSRKGQAVVAKLENLGKPVIAAVNGYALGGGCELALACTIRIASENARFGQPEVKLGIIPGYGGSQRLARIVGEGRAMQLCLTAEQIDAAEAYRIGLVNKVVPAGQALAAAKEMAKAILANGPIACRLVLEAVRRGLEMPLSEGLVFESTLFGLCASTADMKEGMGAFLEKRPARFTGR
ncbi:MAG TPA: enoyl-CoA hydratase-related protein [Thermoanaerobaculia bacterium]|nr:enoyl-CoA hydratase-related protein [Thermoanaerobaculia bacterium]